jgi:predicted transcriptional regulator
MKTATIPSIRVEPELREQVENVLVEGETLSQFVENSVRESVQRRRTQSEFVARGLASLANAKATGIYVDVGVTLGKLDAMLATAKAKAARKKAAKA